MRKIVQILTLFVFLWFLSTCNNVEVKRLYYASGQLESESETKDGMIKNGLAKAYYENGVLSYMGNFRDDHRIDWHSLYYPEGQIHERKFYIIENGKELASRTIRFNKKGDTISDFSYSRKKVSIEIRNKKPYKINDTLSVKLKILDPKYPYSDAIFGKFDQNLNVIGDPLLFSDRIFGNTDHEIFMKLLIKKPGFDTLKWMLKNYDFKYKTDTTGYSYGENAYFSYPIEVLESPI